MGDLEGDLRSAEQQVTQQAATIRTLTRLVKNEYISWHKAGGPNECTHGFAAGIACRQCDLAVLANLRSEQLRAGLKRASDEVCQSAGSKTGSR